MSNQEMDQKMQLQGLFERGSVGVLEQVMRFTEARHQVLVNNVSNFDTVGYKMKDLPVAEFRAALEKAVDRRDTGGANGRLSMSSTKHLYWDRQGGFTSEAAEIEGNNVLFHDENNRFVEKQMSDMAENGLLHNVAAELLRQQYNVLETAIRGRL